MTSGEQLDQQEFTIGRAGLKLPNYEWWEPTRDPAGNFLRFFRKLWEANDFALETTQHLGYGEYRPISYRHEIVLPAEPEKPLSVLRSTYIPRPKDDIDFEKRRNRQQAEWGIERVTPTGTETHEVLAPPSTLGAFSSVFKVTETHVSGGSWGRYGPSITWNGQILNEHDFTLPAEESLKLPVQESIDRQMDAYNTALKSIFSEILTTLT